MRYERKRGLFMVGALGFLATGAMLLLLRPAPEPESFSRAQPEASLHGQTEEVDHERGEIASALQAEASESIATDDLNGSTTAQATAQTASEAEGGDEHVLADSPANPDGKPAAANEVAQAIALGAPAELAKVGFGSRDYTDVDVFNQMQHDLLTAMVSEDPAPMQAMRARMVLVDQRRQNQLRRLAHERGIPFQEVTHDGRARRLMGLRDGEPVYLQSENVAAAETTGANLVRQQSQLDPVHGAAIDGSGLRIQIHDFGLIFDHDEFLRADGTSRIITAYSDIYTIDHGTHIAGTILAAGKDPKLKGMAPRAEAISLPTYSPGYMFDLAMSHPHHADQTAFACISIGFYAGGGYLSDDAYVDDLARAQPYFLLFISAGNAGSSGWGTISGDIMPKEAKNVLCIGSVTDGTRNDDGQLTAGGIISESSSLGPNEDGRIKPDLLGNGQGVTSTTFDFWKDPPDKSTTGIKSGTSMATPNAAGSALLLQDYHSKLFTTPMPAQTLKALLIHSADDRGNAGPDYTHGWGLVNVHAGALILRGAADGSMPRAISEAMLTDGGTFERRFTWDGISPLRATCQWWDPALPEERYAENDANLRDPHLVNDLDLRLIAPDGTVHQPYVMPYVIGGFKEEDIGDTATTGDNTTDNVEMVHVDNPTQTGEWTLRVTHKGSLVGGEQSFSLILTGVGTAVSEPLITGVMPASGTGRAMELRVSGSDLQAGSTLHLRRGQTAIPGTAGARTMGGELLARFDLRDAEAGAWDMEVRNPDGTSFTLSDAFTVRPILARYLDEDFEDDFALGTGGWASGAAVGSDDWQRTTARSASAAHSLFAPAADTATDSWVRSPTVTLDDSFQGSLRLVFDQYSATEANFDGVLCEIQVDGGSWQDITTYGSFLSGGYTGALFGDRVEGESFEVPNVPNPLAGRSAWHGRSGGWMTTIVDLDEAALAGRAVALRWRHAADGEIAKEGWYLDDVTLGDEGSAPQEFRQITITSDPAWDPGWMIPPAAPIEVPIDDGQRFEDLDRQQEYLISPEQEPGPINN